MDSSSSTKVESQTEASSSSESIVSETPIYTCPFRPDKSKPTATRYKENCETLCDHIRESVAKWPDHPCMGNRVKLPNGKFGDYSWITFKQLWKNVEDIGSALVALGCKKKDRIGVMSITCTEFMTMDITLMTYGFCSVPLYTSLGPEAVPYAINHSNTRIVFVSTDLFPVIKKAARCCPNLKAVVVFGHGAAELSKDFPPRDFSVLSRIEEDDHDYFSETYDPTDPTTHNNGLSAAPDPQEEFKKFTGKLGTLYGLPIQPLVEEEDGTTNDSGKAAESSSATPESSSSSSASASSSSTDSTSASSQPLSNLHYRLFTWDEIVAHGAKNHVEAERPKSDDILSIMYTSGTTGVPKGVILKNSNLLSTVTAGFIAGMDVFTPEDSYYAYLPLAHVFERLIEYALLIMGSKIGYYSGDTRELVAEINVLKPTLFVGVPRILNRVYESFVAGVEKMGGCARGIFNTCFDKKKKAHKENRNDTPWLDKLVFNKTKEKLGGKLVFVMCGSAPLNPKVHEYLQCVLSLPIQCGYSMTETTCSGAIPKYPAFNTFGHCGPVMSSVETKLVSVPEMDYDAARREGEILMRGPAVFHGYFRDPWQSREAFTEDGFVKSGDIGRFDEEGNLYVVDRKKNIFKLAQGEYIAPEVTEAVYLRSEYVEQVFVHGESEWRYSVALVCPRAATVQKWAEAAHPEWKGVEWSELTQKPELKKMLLQELTMVGKAAGLNSYQMAHNIIVMDKPFSEEYVTPSLKLKRFLIIKNYRNALTNCYSEIQA
ncbi:long-chain acyl-CoA synthetase [Monocercomonoides exilis]|uniref:long-chain acyl-CoA synthetase n=1 Tax=Monocercomonoides exilis TaxID=2049356 RepID=UPI003559AD2E|nr:long-chain acyl-CoA synthetase [Monocercomonoides exilis]|eukprot:MONOS_1564.1-p1 / transcript=MONOS_1564.1 / gene=MONOS_1564 / organism=Monocercomonoides_exilis_PA203 / gene_product=long-chain acyl-CoA synthetase [EC:6.2.1.3] / transcript_product=long-chain acyl-CoA synthetase [EC:6.2.1.3] / location=Mono_scaffold00028:41920-44443(+) / protein_length=770 / sequence_SO=supercontig / SO=protein_coding / is_pseudo=false